MQVGKSMRLKRVIDPAGVSVICALDHGMTAPTFLDPLAVFYRIELDGQTVTVLHVRLYPERRA